MSVASPGLCKLGKSLAKGASSCTKSSNIFATLLPLTKLGSLYIGYIFKPLLNPYCFIFSGDTL